MTTSSLYSLLGFYGKSFQSVCRIFDSLSGIYLFRFHIRIEKFCTAQGPLHLFSRSSGSRIDRAHWLWVWHLSHQKPPVSSRTATQNTQKSQYPMEHLILHSAFVCVWHQHRFQLVYYIEFKLELNEFHKIVCVDCHLADTNMFIWNSSGRGTVIGQCTINTNSLGK